MAVEPIVIEPDAWCAWCGDPLPEPEERHWRTRYCSRRCKMAMDNDKVRERKRAARPMRNCLWCGKAFLAWPLHKATCTRACSDLFDRSRKAERYAAGQAERPCPICGTLFRPSRKGQAVCGPGCSGRYVWHLRRAREGR